ncbi:hypothetical protein [Paenibacillus polymyxa]|uniref:hypothetical protein n=1 Tax=Paenibacillus polymyxa TaxID=1406 RepID=UPI00287FA39A|nr:hypothetical protein [Paenibacillus polymyxa]
MKRNIGDEVRINPYAQVTGIIIGRKDSEENYAGFDYKVKLNLHNVDKETVYFANYNECDKYWWNYFNDDELDLLERNYNLFSS